MDAKTETALCASIAHWEDVVTDPLNTEVGASECALCRLFHWHYHDGYTCCGCPVMEKTGMELCDGSPYEEFCNVDDDDEPELRRLASLELEFLKSLLP